MGATEVAVQGLVIAIGNGQSPETFQTLANVESYSQAGQTRVVDTSNVTDLWQRYVPTLLEAGKITMTIFWVMNDPTHSSATGGLRALWQNKTRADFQLHYPLAGGGGIDSFAGYVTKYSHSGKVADVFKAQIEISATGTPSLV